MMLSVQAFSEDRAGLGGSRKIAHIFVVLALDGRLLLLDVLDCTRGSTTAPVPPASVSPTHVVFSDGGLGMWRIGGGLRSTHETESPLSIWSDIACLGCT